MQVKATASTHFTKSKQVKSGQYTMGWIYLSEELSNLKHLPRIGLFANTSTDSLKTDVYTVPNSNFLSFLTIFHTMILSMWKNQNIFNGVLLFLQMARMCVTRCELKEPSWVDSVEYSISRCRSDHLANMKYNHHYLLPSHALQIQWPTKGGRDWRLPCCRQMPVKSEEGTAGPSKAQQSTAGG